MKFNIRITRLAIYVTLVSGLNLPDLYASAPPPKPIVWTTSANKQFEIKRDNKLRVISIYRTGKRAQALWQVKVPDLIEFHSQIQLCDSGNHLLHIYSNHSVKRLSDTAVHIYHKNRRDYRLPASLFIDRLLPPIDAGLSTSPDHRWFNKVGKVTDKSFTLINAKGETKVVMFKTIGKYESSQKEPRRKNKSHQLPVESQP